MGCPDEGTLLLYAAGQMRGADLQRIDQHIDRCPTCAELVVHAAREAAMAAPETACSSEIGTHDWADTSAPGRSPRIPLKVGRYVVLERIGEGGMGTVVAAFDPRLQRQVAIKLLRRDRAVDALRLKSEARSLAALAHPNVVGVFETGTRSDRGAAGQVYLVMELVHGVTLGQWCRTERRRPDEIVRAYVDAGRGLAAAHEAGLVHRDFKPDNVLVSRDGSVRVTDFGLARVTDDTAASVDTGPLVASTPPTSQAHLTRPGMVVGTPAYMAPEQRAGKDVDGRADQYAFCVSLWEALSGQRPDSDPAAEPRMPKHIRRALQRGLDPDPLLRWPDMNALLRELDRPPRRRRPIAVGSAIGLGLVATLIGLAWPASSPKTADCARAPTAVEDTVPADCLVRVEPKVRHSPAQRALVSSVEAELERARKLREAGRVSEAVELTSELQTKVHALRDPRLAAAVALERGWQLYDASQFPEASRALDAAHEIAWAEGFDDIAAEAASLQSAVLGVELDDVDAGLEWSRRAVAAVERLPPEKRPEARLLVASARVELLTMAGQMDEAREEAQSAVFAAEEQYGPDDPALVLKLLALAHLIRDADSDAALAHCARALDIARRSYGENHPEVAYVLQDLGVLHQVRGDHERALEPFERASEILQATYGSHHQNVGQVLYNLGVVYDELGDDVVAFGHYRRAADIFAETLGPNHRRSVVPITALGNLAFKAGDHATAEASYQRALVLYEESLGADHEDCGTPLSWLAEIEIVRNRGDRAVEYAERALDVSLGKTALDDASLHFRLARALEVAGRGEAARWMAVLAVMDVHRAADPDVIAENAPVIEAWLREHDDQH